jgi:hypothetical protein
VRKPEAQPISALPRRCSSRLPGENHFSPATPRSPTASAAFPERIGSISAGISSAEYWLSASVLTTMSAPRRSDSSSPAANAAASPRCAGRETTQSAPEALAAFAVASLLPSSTTSTSTELTPRKRRGSARSAAGRVCSSL